MKYFEEILQAIGAQNITLIHEDKSWDVWSVNYQTPKETIIGYYISLRHKCSINAVASVTTSDKWKLFCKNEKYEIVLTPKSPLLSSTDRIEKFHKGCIISTTKSILFDNLVMNVTSKEFPVIDYYIDPTIELNDTDEHHKATDYLTSWIKGSIIKNHEPTKQSSSISVLVANAGIGKTTVSRQLCNKLRSDSQQIIPILVESEQWRNMIGSQIKMEDIWYKALSRMFNNAGALLDNKNALKVLIREGIFVIVFDGFDELCAANDSSLLPEEILDHLQQMLSHEDDIILSKIIITSRHTFWESIKDNIKKYNLDVYNLVGFNNKQKKDYFIKRLDNIAERDLAFRISKEIGGGIYGGLKIENKNEDRPSGVPFILDLIARYVLDNPDANIAYETDPFSRLLEGICLRENRRQDYNIDIEKQFILFEELFRDHPKSFSYEDLKLYLEVICNIKDHNVVKKFAQHAFIAPAQNGDFQPQYEVLQVYFLARFLVNSLSETINEPAKAKVLEILSNNKSGRTEVIDLLSNQLLDIPDDKLLLSLKHAYDIANNSDDIIKIQSMMAIFHLVSNLIKFKDKEERSESLRKYLFFEKTNNTHEVIDKVFTGIIQGYNFSDTNFINCTIIDAEFKNCIFNNNTNFTRCSAPTTLEFKNCTNSNNINEIDCSFSEEAEYSFKLTTKSGIRDNLKNRFAEEALHHALKKFKGEVGFHSIKYSNRRGGSKKGNPYSDLVWDSLLRNKVIERHHISNIRDGGLNIIDDKKLHNEILFFLDNAHLGGNLKIVCNTLTK